MQLPPAGEGEGRISAFLCHATFSTAYSKLPSAMFCPQCKAEYRQGFTVCADCEVPLVWQLPASTGAANEAESSGQDPESTDDRLCTFWKGDDPRIHIELCQLLDEEGIPHKTIRRQDHLFNLNSKSAFQIGIPFSCFEKAEAAVKEAYGTGEDETNNALHPTIENSPSFKALINLPLREKLRERPREEQPDLMESLTWRRSERQEEHEEESLTESTASASGSWDPENWYNADASVEVWSGDQPELGELIVASLKENQIHSRLDCTVGKCALFVLPDDESRAREIVREIIEGVPPT